MNRKNHIDYPNYNGPKPIDGQGVPIKERDDKEAAFKSDNFLHEYHFKDQEQF